MKEGTYSSIELRRHSSRSQWFVEGIWRGGKGGGGWKGDSFYDLYLWLFVIIYNNLVQRGNDVGN